MQHKITLIDVKELYYIYKKKKKSNGLKNGSFIPLVYSTNCNLGTLAIQAPYLKKHEHLLKQRTKSLYQFNAGEISSHALGKTIHSPTHVYSRQ